MAQPTRRYRPARAAVNILLTLLMSFGVTAAVTPAAQAAPAKAQAECWTPTANGEGSATFYGEVYLKSGPYNSGCANTGFLSWAKTVYFHCWHRNSQGEVWWYVRIAGTQTHGWVKDSPALSGTSQDENGDGQIVFYQC